MWETDTQGHGPERPVIRISGVLHFQAVLAGEHFRFHILGCVVRRHASGLHVVLREHAGMHQKGGGVRHSNFCVPKNDLNQLSIEVQGGAGRPGGGTPAPPMVVSCSNTSLSIHPGEHVRGGMHFCGWVRNVCSLGHDYRLLPLASCLQVQPYSLWGWGLPARLSKCAGWHFQAHALVWVFRGILSTLPVHRRWGDVW